MRFSILEINVVLMTPARRLSVLIFGYADQASMQVVLTTPAHRQCKIQTSGSI